MADIDYYFNFLSDAQGFVDGGLSSYLTFSWSGADGSPAAGCLQIVTTSTGGPGVQGEETATQTVGYNTWNSLGVPSGATVTAVRLLGFNYISPVVPFVMDFDIVDAGGSSILTGPLRPGSSTAAIAFTWASTTGPGAVGVNAGSSTASTPIRLKLTFNPNNSGTLATTFKVDSIGLRITYTPGVDPPAVGGSGGGWGPGAGILSKIGIPRAVANEVLVYLYAESFEATLYVESVEDKLLADSLSPKLTTEYDFA